MQIFKYVESISSIANTDKTISQLITIPEYQL